MSDDEARRKRQKPQLSLSRAAALLECTFDLSVSALRRLDSYDDANFAVTLDNGDILTLKVHNGVETDQPEVLEAQVAMCEHLAAAGFACPAAKALSGKPVIVSEALPVADGSERPCAVKLLAWVPGEPLCTAGATPGNLEAAGAYLGRLNQALDGFAFEKLKDRYHAWDLRHAPGVRRFLDAVKNGERRSRVEAVIDAMEREVLPLDAELRRGALMGDFNDANIIMNPRGEVSGVVDFGDIVHSWRVNDVAIAMAYAMVSTFGKEEEGRLGAAAAALLLKGFASEYALSAVEIPLLRTLVCCRLALSVTYGAYSSLCDPDNEYLLLHAEPAWRALQLLWEAEAEEVDQLFASALAGELSPAAALLASRRLGAGDAPPAKRTLRTVTFVTGNVGKLAEVIAILEKDAADPLPFRVTNIKLDLPELQGTPASVAAEKCKLAAAEVGGPVMVEDTSLCFKALGDLPSVYIKWFLEALGHAGLNAMLAGFDDKAAYAQCVFAFCDGPGEEVEIFVGRTEGRIVSARGPADFGWDPIFEPSEGAGLTYAEMPKAAKNAISHRYRALDQLREFLRERFA